MSKIIKNLRKTKFPIKVINKEIAAAVTIPAIFDGKICAESISIISQPITGSGLVMLRKIQQTYEQTMRPENNPTNLQIATQIQLNSVHSFAQSLIDMPYINSEMEVHSCENHEV